MMSQGKRPGQPAVARAYRFELSLWYEEDAADDPAHWGFTLADPNSNEHVRGVGMGALPEAVALLTGRARVASPSRRSPPGA